MVPATESYNRNQSSTIQEEKCDREGRRYEADEAIFIVLLFGRHGGVTGTDGAIHNIRACDAEEI